MAATTFENLWSNYPKSDPCTDPKTGQPPRGYKNQCAIRLGTALQASGVSFKSFRGSVCPVSTRDSGMAASAQQLADWLKKKPFPECGAVEAFTGASVFEKISDRTGIIFLANYWQRDPEIGTSRRSGDHIDLWNGSRMSGLLTWFRVNWHVSWDGALSDFRLASTALFFAVK